MQVPPSSGVPTIAIDRLSQDEREDAWMCLRCLHHIESRCEDFRSALKLFDFAWRIVAVDQQMVKPHTKLIQSWQLIAARDGAMSIYHFAKAMDGANTWAFRHKIIGDKVDKTLLRKSFKQLQQSFPRLAAMRHSIAHSTELIKNPDWYKDHAFTGSYDRHGIQLDNAKNFMATNVLSGNTFISTFENEIIEYEISQNSLDQLIEIRTLFFSAFSGLENNSP